MDQRFSQRFISHLWFGRQRFFQHNDKGSVRCAKQPGGRKDFEFRNNKPYNNEQTQNIPSKDRHDYWDFHTSYRLNYVVGFWCFGTRVQRKQSVVTMLWFFWRCLNDHSFHLLPKSNHQSIKGGYGRMFLNLPSIFTVKI